MLLGGIRLATPDDVVDDAWLTVDGDRVTRVGRGRAPGRVDLDLDGALVVPGFVDLHCHGGGGASYGSDDAGRAAAFHLWHGTTTTLASLVSGPPDVLEEQVSRLAALTRDGLVAGTHLEGPFLARTRCGAHDPTVLRDPSLAEIDRLTAAAGGTLRMMTLAPERAGALDAIARLTTAGVVAAIGHTEATYEQTRAAIAAGARVATHIGNAMPPVHHRMPGPVLALLEDDRVACELINDGIHLHPAFVTDVRRRAGAERVVLITDAIAAAGTGDGEFRVGAVAVRVSGGAARVEATGVLAGSTLTLGEAFRRAVTEGGFSIPEAVRATSTTAARLLGRPDRGYVRVGAQADLVVLDTELRVDAVLHRGVWVERPCPA
jgi:N-acetylglucosamine-6-phosphate deacetylase